MPTTLTIPNLKSHLVGEIKTIANLVGEKNSMKFISSCIACFQSVPALATCQPASLINSFLEAARIGLFPSNSLGEAYILPYRKGGIVLSQFQIGYKGFVTLFYRAGVASVSSQVAFANDEFKYEYGLDPILRHVPADGERGEAIAAYAIAKVQGEKIFRVMTKKEIMKIKATSKAKNSEYSPWNSNDPEKWMWQKTVIKQLSKLLPKTEKLSRAIEVDNICERGGFFGEKKAEIIEADFAPSDDEKIDETNSKRDEFRKKKDAEKKEDPPTAECEYCGAPAGAVHDKDCPNLNHPRK